MSGLGLLATAFGSYASTLGGLYKEQVEKEQAAQEKLAAEERQREWERQKTAEERMFAIDMLQRKFEQSVALADYEHKLKLEEKERDFEYDQRRAVYGHELELKKQEELKRLNRRDDLARLMIGQGVGNNSDPKNTRLVVDALINQLRITGKMIENARPEERQRWLDQYNAIQQKLNNLLGLGNVGGTLFINPEDIINSLANE